MTVVEDGGGRMARERTGPRWGAGRSILITLLATLVVSVLLYALPDLDTGMTALFYQTGRGFAAEESGWLLVLREAGRLATWVLALAALVPIGLKIAKPAWVDGVDVRRPLFLGASLIAGPLVVVNLILKQHWGRARPNHVDLYGGTAQFTPPWIPADQCAANCSFVSGEASTAVLFMAFAILAPARWRLPIVVTAAVWTVAISLNRIAFGAHFLSDVVIAWGLTLLVMFVMRDIFLVRMSPDQGRALDAALARFGRGIAGRFRADR
ncbi:phosphatase PAP2 family protein [Prosthecodimorpha staleyi]|uniref:Phosphatase PAP2 family protein n=1 Tax=Prosthecodimorpha staleyi TaxID=2840188 RepID=A0A947GGL1_9HYPH|nr:phosphatase PAP2 family protein [Prosthecodimorpha staleyi]MBT9292415.1 phosphatase PAP2 family protein [Prosthecodimorpha staleyi]